MAPVGGWQVEQRAAQPKCSQLRRSGLYP